jgi:hypothetical protein
MPGSSVSLLLRVVKSALEPLHEFRYPALQSGLLFRSGQIAHNLPPQRCAHAAERRLRAWGISQRENKKQREDGFARLSIAFQGNFHDRTGIDSQFLADVAMDGYPVAPLSPRDQGRPKGDSLDGTTNRHVGLTAGQRTADFGGNVNIADQAHLVDTPGENMQ